MHPWLNWASSIAKSTNQGLHFSLSHSNVKKTEVEFLSKHEHSWVTDIREVQLLREKSKLRVRVYVRAERMNIGVI